MSDDQLRFLKTASVTCPDPVRQIHNLQVLAKFLSPCEFDFGARPNKLSRFRYAPGEMVLCARDSEEWVRYRTPAEVLLIALPDGILQSVAAEMGRRHTEMECEPHMEDVRVRALASAAEMEYASGSPAGRIYMDSIARALAAALLQSRGSLTNAMHIYRGGLAPRQLRRVTGFVHEHLNRNLSLAQLADQADLSPTYFSQMFRKSTGLAPHKFVLRARVERAKELLRRRNFSILDVSMECGFQTQQHFARVFRAMVKVSPTEFRRLGI